MRALVEKLSLGAEGDPKGSGTTCLDLALGRSALHPHTCPWADTDALCCSGLCSIAVLASGNWAPPSPVYSHSEILLCCRLFSGREVG